MARLEMHRFCRDSTGFRAKQSGHIGVFRFGSTGVSLEGVQGAPKSTNQRSGTLIPLEILVFEPPVLVVRIVLGLIRVIN